MLLKNGTSSLKTPSLKTVDLRREAPCLPRFRYTLLPHLAEIQGVESEIIELGFQIVAISPDSPENLQITDEKHKLNYSLLSDGDAAFIKAMGIAFKVPERSVERLVRTSGGLNEGFLPVPSVFVLDTSGKIQFEYINPNYRTRLSAGLLLAVLKEQNGINQ